MSVTFQFCDGVLMIRVMGPCAGSEIFRSFRGRFEASPYFAGLPTILDIRQWTGAVNDEEWRAFRQWLLRFATHHDIKDPTPRLIFLGRKGAPLDAIAHRARLIRERGEVGESNTAENAWMRLVADTPPPHLAKAFLEQDTP